MIFWKAITTKTHQDFINTMEADMCSLVMFGMKNLKCSLNHNLWTDPTMF